MIRGIVIAEVALVFVFLINVVLYLITNTEFFLINAGVVFILLFALGIWMHAALELKFIEFLVSGGLG